MYAATKKVPWKIQAITEDVSLITLTPYMVLPLFATRFAACTRGIQSLSHSHVSLSGEPDYFGRKKISSGGDLSHYSSASLY